MNPDADTTANWRNSLLAREENHTDNALIVAQNALAGYVQLSNSPDTEEHHATARHAFKVVAEAIRKRGALERQGIVR